MVEEISFVRLVPTDLKRSDWTNVQAIDVWGVDEGLNQFRIFSDGGDYKTRPKS
jgi:hypothetical protein